jgi:precorrin-6A/cobalt-precorrin-6A reductase
MILLLGGTKDARLLIPALREAFPEVTLLASAVSEYGAELLRRQTGCRVLQGKLDAAALIRLIREKEVRVLLDATHPFAENASCEATAAAQEAGIPYLRFARPKTEDFGEGVWPVPDFKAAALMASQFAGTIFLTIGTRRLAEFLTYLPRGRRVVARVLPEPESVARCRELGLDPADIIAIQGPLSVGLNAALFTAFQAGVVVSKESGESGGTQEKVEAARLLNLPVILVSRPAKRAGPDCPAQVVAELRKIIS